jgi:hypothetical protein
VILARAHIADRGIGDTASSPSQYFSDPLSHSHAGGPGWVPRPGLRGHLRLQPLDRAKDRERHREHSELARTEMIFSPLSPSRFTKHISLASSPYFLLLCKLQCAPCADCLMPPTTRKIFRKCSCSSSHPRRRSHSRRDDLTHVGSSRLAVAESYGHCTLENAGAGAKISCH